MTRDLVEIKQGLAQARTALNLLEKFITEYETRSVNILPCEDVKFYEASDDDVSSGNSFDTTSSMNDAIRETAQTIL